MRHPHQQCLVRAANAGIRVYQIAISPLIGGSCRFTPTCSRYAQEALSEHGMLQGTMFTGWRILRCGPWIPAGTDDSVPIRAVDETPSLRPTPHPQ
ncbi:MAG: membrane protein insertion efficiency factor YidD [bacterium]|nr:membrane protein insertion efficiency factor YidD [bacterium]